MNLKFSAFIAAASVWLIPLLPGSATASSVMLPDAYADFVLTLNNTNQGFFNNPLLTPSAKATLGSGSDTAIGTASLTPSPIITGTASVSSGGLAESYTSFSYWFEVIAPTAESAHLIFAANAGLSAGGPNAKRGHVNCRRREPTTRIVGERMFGKLPVNLSLSPDIQC
jgi:hypothetical protein